jgi:hypothetical protein
MNSIVELIAKIQERPSMYLSRNYISCLKAFISGWYLRSPDEIPDGHLLESFQIWIAKKYKIKTSHSWDSILLFYSEDETAALKLFFSEFDLFLKTSQK